MNPFDHFAVPLKGSRLIESSAGTGKTYAIASLYVRLLLERTLQVREILVVTFTEAATEDLRKRIREKVREALQAFEGNDTKDLFLRRLLEKVPDRLRAVGILNTAIQSFDEAAIFTIHGFCQKILQENAFETSSLFDTKLVTDQRDILQEIVEDFWRIHFYTAPAGFVRHALRQNLSPKRLIEFLGNSVSNPFLTIIPQSDSPDFKKFASLEDRLQTCYERARRVWASSKQEIQELLSSHQGLNKRTYGQAAIALAISGAERYLSSGNSSPSNSALVKLCSSEISRWVNKGFSPPAHGFFVICENLEEASDDLTKAYDRHVIALKSALFRYAKDELRERKRRQNVRYFDDLLLDLYSILQGSRGREVGQSVRSRYKAALIDEFQDTDPVQYAVFEAVYNDPEAALFLIGDPKQAIYSFRGADIFAYIKASKSVSERYTLSHNWRSTPELIAATNAIFNRTRPPFVFPEIEFHPAKAADKPPSGGFTWAGGPDRSPFKIWFMNRSDGQNAKSIHKGVANRFITGAVAGEILRLLEAGRTGLALVDGKPVSPWDIAVLVRTNQEAKLIQEALQRLKIPSVLYSDESVFASREAAEVSRILEAIVELSEPKVRAALVTDILGVSGNDLALLNENDARWTDWLQTFADYRQIWIEEGFMPMARILIARERVRHRLLSYVDGERRLTNLLHCYELLHQAALTHSLGLESLVKWLAERRENMKTLQGEEYQLRLETDAKAVKVITIHKSKGLEYPIVFDPFCWNTPSKERTREITFHGGTDRATIIRDIGSERRDENLKRAQQESLAERIRLLYVALTRAKYRCYLVWGAFRDAGLSSLAHLFHGESAEIGDLTDVQIKDELEELVRDSDGAIEISDLPDAESKIYAPVVDPFQSYACRTFHGEIEQNWGTASFTSLISVNRREGDLPDRDKLAYMPAISPESIAASIDPELTIFNFPRGSRAGLFFHEIFQNLDFAAPASVDNQILLREKLATYGFESSWEAPVQQMIGHVLSTPLEHANPEFCLSRVDREERVHEMEFALPLDLLTPERLKKAFASHSGPESLPEFPQRLAQLGFSPVKGLMRGYVDMIFRWQSRFYLLDWKSNFLGPSIEAYGQEDLKEAMQREYYLLQCALYSVALHRYLRFRLPDYEHEKHFGGAFYLFLRGIHSSRGPEFGIYRHRASGQLIKELSRALTDKSDAGSAFAFEN